ncbi:MULTISPECIES: ATP-binding protein [unclassified Ensifer]|uniref:sensor histidine kinase n=1 Tax=unclassified Ensifer TaxID=2633371 RepID=UPI0008130B97|nr:MULTISPECIES: ATP-binding protein [unclassified Ensifer]OCP08416.1 histidine kinase [Ensifer sp. LC11]OCP09035.1 histidine kinase [Ensifer sp. LC13]OCP09818.1 histidine kinase [Ensifer sp. LC14]OCP32275.1 histidine kinase [Ensifer sp. LC499]
MSIASLVRKYGLLLPGLLAVALTVGVFVLRINENLGLAELQRTGTQRLELYATSLNRQIDKYAYFPATLGLERDVIDLVAHGKPITDTVNRYLEQLNQRAGTLSIYLLDRRGQVTAASNWNRPDSFIGEDLSYRSYFTDAMRRRPGRLFGIGITRGEPGYYLSSPLLADGEVEGVAVVKVSLEQLEQSWATVEVPVIVTDQNGVVILASVPSWKFTTLRPLPDAERRRLERSLQYNARPLPSLGLTREQAFGENAVRVRLAPPADVDGSSKLSGNFLAQTAPMGDTGWSLTVLSPVSGINAIAWTRAALAAVASAFIGIVLMLLNQRRQHLHDRLRAREALQRAHDELERKVDERTRTLRAAQDELVHAAKLATIGQISAGLAHEINQPLAALRTLSGNAIKFLRRGDLATAEDNLDRIGSIVDGLGTVTNQLKSFARKSSGTADPVDVRRALDNALFLLDQRLRHANVAVSIEVEAGQATALCDANRLEQVMVNLIANALDAIDNRPSRTLRLRGRREHARIVIEVHDDGPGLPEHVREHLFEPFFTTKESNRGLGLGLAISSEIVHHFGGTLTGANHPEGGAVFVVTLPAAGIGETPWTTTSRS